MNNQETPSPKKAKSGWRDKRLWLVVIGLTGILLIGLTEWIPTKKTAEKPGAVTVSQEAVELALEQRLCAMLTQVKGVGNCRVMVTVEQGTRQVYASSSLSGGESVISVDTDAGPVGLLLTQIQPTVRGVAVVCDGGDNAKTVEQVKQLIMAVLDISSRKVSVAKSN